MLRRFWTTEDFATVELLSFTGDFLKDDFFFWILLVIKDLISDTVGGFLSAI